MLKVDLELVKVFLAINLLVEFRDLVTAYVTKNSAPRNVYYEKLIREIIKDNMYVIYLSSLVLLLKQETMTLTFNY